MGDQIALWQGVWARLFWPIGMSNGLNGGCSHWTGSTWLEVDTQRSALSLDNLPGSSR